MPNHNRKTLAEYRLAAAREKYEVAVILYDNGKYKDAVNRAYYAMFNGLRAVLAIEAVDFKKHSGAISYFRQNYIKTGIFEDELSDIIGAAFLIRNQSDYEDFFIVSNEEAKMQCNNASIFIKAISEYLKRLA